MNKDTYSLISMLRDLSSLTFSVSGHEAQP